MAEAKEIIEKLLTEERVPEFEFGSIYSATIVEILDRGVLVQLHPEMQPVLIPNTQLDAKKVDVFSTNQPKVRLTYQTFKILSLTGYFL